MGPSTNFKVLVTLVLLQIIYLISFSQAYVYMVPNAKSQGKFLQYNLYPFFLNVRHSTTFFVFSVQEDSCYDESLQINVPVNEERQRPGKCESMRCSDDYSLHVAG